MNAKAPQSTKNKSCVVSFERKSKMGVGQDGQINGWAAIFDEIDDLD